jgi:hypothetical protein
VVRDEVVTVDVIKDGIEGGVATSCGHCVRSGIGVTARFLSR